MELRPEALSSFSSITGWGTGDDCHPDANQIMASIVQRRKLQVGLMLLLLLRIVTGLCNGKRCSGDQSAASSPGDAPAPAPEPMLLLLLYKQIFWPATNCCRCDNRTELQLWLVCASAAFACCHPHAHSQWRPRSKARLMPIPWLLPLTNGGDSGVAMMQQHLAHIAA